MKDFQYKVPYMRKSDGPIAKLHYKLIPSFAWVNRSIYIYINKYIYIYITRMNKMVRAYVQGPLLVKWINFYPILDKQLYTIWVE